MQKLSFCFLHSVWGDDFQNTISNVFYFFNCSSFLQNEHYSTRTLNGSQNIQGLAVIQAILYYEIYITKYEIIVLGVDLFCSDKFRLELKFYYCLELKFEKKIIHL